MEKALAGQPCAFDSLRTANLCRHKPCVVDTRMILRTSPTFHVPGAKTAMMLVTEKIQGARFRVFHVASVVRQIDAFYAQQGHTTAWTENVKVPESAELVFAMFFVGLYLIATYILIGKNEPVFPDNPCGLAFRCLRCCLELIYAGLHTCLASCALQFFNFTADIATPECLLAGVFTYEMKFYGTLLAAPAFIFFLVLAQHLESMLQPGMPASQAR